MAKTFDPRRVLKCISKSLLREFFAKRGELLDVPWDTLTEHKMDPVFEAWQALPVAQRTAVHDALFDIAEVSDHRGVAVLAQDVKYYHPELTARFDAQDGLADRAMLVYLHAPELLEHAAMFARADALIGGKYWRTRDKLPGVDINTPDSVCKALANELASYYTETQLRGRRCHVTHCRRSGGVDYFFAFLDDYQDKSLVFEDNADEPVLRRERHAFENVFAYNGKTGTLDLTAHGGKPVHAALQYRFCKAVLGIEVEPADPAKASYALDHLLGHNFPLHTDPADCVEDARITRLRIAPRGGGGSYIEVKADARGGRNDIYTRMDRLARMENLPPASIAVTQVTFSLRLAPVGKGRAQTITFDVSAPHSCNLRNKPDAARLIGGRCLRHWKVTSEPSSPHPGSVLGDGVPVVTPAAREHGSIPEKTVVQSAAGGPSER